MALRLSFVTSTIGIRSGVLARWVSLVGFACGLVLLVTSTDFPWLALIFASWMIVVSRYILVAGRRA